MKAEEKGETRKWRALTSAALAIPALTPGTAGAEPLFPGSEVRFQYYDYEDRQEGGRDRMRIRAPLAWMRVPVSEKTTLEGSFVFDSMSGASPMFHNTLSGASGVGVEDDRWAGDLSVARKFDGFQITVGGEYSDEDDYLSRGGSVEAAVPFNNSNTTLTFGMSTSYDQISSTNNPELNEERSTWGGLIGVTQVVNRNSILQSNLTFSTASGYLSDQYKSFDQRPSDRELLAWLTRYNYFLEALDASLHMDYRFALDSWGLRSHTFDVALYQPLSNWLMVRPSVRYYTQNEADFYSQVFPPAQEGEYTADHRMAAFGGLTLGLKLIAEMGESFEASLLGAYVQQQPGWRLGSPGSEGLDTFYARYIGGGIALKW